MDDLRVAAVVMRSGFGETESNLDKMERFVRAAASQEAGLICFPEMCITGYALNGEIENLAEPVPGPSAREVQRIAREHDIVIIAGLAERTDEGKVAVTQIVVSPQGEVGRYRKMHLSKGEQALFEPGSHIPVFHVGRTTVGVQLCYDAHFPELSTMLALKGAEVLLIPHASPPPETSGEKLERWLRYLSARAYDNSVFLVACNQTGEGGAGIRFAGVALILDPRGEVIAETSGDDEKMLIADLETNLLEQTRNTRMGFFLAHRRPELYGPLADPVANSNIAVSSRFTSVCEEEAPEPSNKAQAASNS